MATRLVCGCGGLCDSGGPCPMGKDVEDKPVKKKSKPLPAGLQAVKDAAVAVRLQREEEARQELEVRATINRELLMDCIVASVEPEAVAAMEPIDLSSLDLDAAEAELKMFLPGHLALVTRFASDLASPPTWARYPYSKSSAWRVWRDGSRYDFASLGEALDFATMTPEELARERAEG